MSEAEYAERAAECMELAKAASNDAERMALLDKAAAWLSAALAVAAGEDRADAVSGR